MDPPASRRPAVDASSRCWSPTVTLMPTVRPMTVNALRCQACVSWWTRTYDARNAQPLPRSGSARFVLRIARAHGFAPNDKSRAQLGDRESCRRPQAN